MEIVMEFRFDLLRPPRIPPSPFQRPDYPKTVPAKLPLPRPPPFAWFAPAIANAAAKGSSPGAA
jgi:hypothetical protein